MPSGSGTATPTAEDQRDIPHHLLDVADPSAPWTLDDWLRAAEAAIAAVRDRGHWPIVVGGTNLYLQALLFGLLDGPAPDQALRDALMAKPREEVRSELERLDPEAAAAIHPNDLRRTIRAIEYARGSGTSIAQAQVQWAGACRPDTQFIGLTWPTDMINRRINARVAAMVDGGLLEEVRGLHAANSMGPQAAAAVGYAQLVDHLEGRCTLEAAVEQVKIKTRRFAKQQRTWLRRFRAIPGSIWLEPEEHEPQVLSQQALTELLSRWTTA